MKPFIQNRGQFREHVKGKVPLKSEVYRFINDTTEYLFPVLAEDQLPCEESCLDRILLHLEKTLNAYETGLADVHAATLEFKQALPELYRILVSDATGIYDGDPAASSIEEVIISYPGFYAIMIYRIAHELDRISVPFIPRMLTEYAHSKTGIDINPKATIGRSFCIDHGTGIVIGETAVIGRSVKMYQGVTLGALSVNKDGAGSKRHPTIENSVTLYAGCTILGGDTIIGHDSVIGGNVWLTHSVEPHSMVINQDKIRMIDKSMDLGNIGNYVI
ncbi:MAG: serine O-acetyltransferase [Bacteroidales bacterium]|jgi:serine O-acetyltransferase